MNIQLRPEVGRAARACLKRRIAGALSLLALVLLVACSNGDSNGDSATPVSLSEFGVTTILAKSNSFSTARLTGAAGQEITIKFYNQDSVNLHNFHVLAADEGDFKTEIELGPDTQSLTFTIKAAGTYRFQCDTHPDQMNGTLVIQ